MATSRNGFLPLSGLGTVSLASGTPISKSDGHVVDHALHAVDVGGQFSDQRLFGKVLGDAADRDDAVGRSDLGVGGTR